MCRNCGYIFKNFRVFFTIQIWCEPIFSNACDCFTCYNFISLNEPHKTIMGIEGLGEKHLWLLTFTISCQKFFLPLKLQLGQLASAPIRFTRDLIRCRRYMATAESIKIVRIFSLEINKANVCNLSDSFEIKRESVNF